MKVGLLYAERAAAPISDSGTKEQKLKNLEAQVAVCEALHSFKCVLMLQDIAHRKT